MPDSVPPGSGEAFDVDPDLPVSATNAPRYSAEELRARREQLGIRPPRDEPPDTVTAE